MNNTISTTAGIDTVIQSIQTDLYEELKVDWVNSIDAHGRVYRNIDANGKTKPRWYVSNGEYKDVYYNDEYACSFMFVDDEEHDTEDEYLFTTGVKVVFMVDLQRILPEETGRADMIAQSKVVDILRTYAFERFSVTGITKGLRNVFRGFDTGSIKFSDIQPYHCFSINLDLNYHLKTCN